MDFLAKVMEYFQKLMEYFPKVMEYFPKLVLSLSCIALQFLSRCKVTTTRPPHFRLLHDNVVFFLIITDISFFFSFLSQSR